MQTSWRRQTSLVADSIPQCLERGEIYQALKTDSIRQEELVELGSIIAGDSPGKGLG